MSDKLIVVKSLLPKNKDGSWPLAVHEKDDAHPDGEIYVKGEKEFKVAPTSAVTAAIQSKKLKVVSGGSPDPDALLESGASNTGEGLPPSGGSDASTNTGATDNFPEDFPHREALNENGVTTVEQLKAMSKDEILNLKGIGEASFEDIRKAVKKL